MSRINQISQVTLFLGMIGAITLLNPGINSVHADESNMPGNGQEGHAKEGQDRDRGSVNPMPDNGQEGHGRPLPPENQKQGETDQQEGHGKPNPATESSIGDSDKGEAHGKGDKNHISGDYTLGADGNCRDLDGIIGLNKLSLPSTAKDAVVRLIQVQGAQCVDLRGYDLSRADLTGADLSGADLTSANLEGTILTNANMAHVIQD